MNDLEKRAHDITVSILPHVIAEGEFFRYYERQENGRWSFNHFDVVEEYVHIYEGLLKELQDYGIF